MLVNTYTEYTVRHYKTSERLTVFGVSHQGALLLILEILQRAAGNKSDLRPEAERLQAIIDVYDVHVT